MIPNKIADALHHLYDRSNTMTATLQTILDKLNQQGQQIEAQGEQIDKLIADRSAQEQADLQKISDLLDANTAAAQANADKMTSVLAADAAGTSTGAGTSGGTTGASTTVTIDPATGQQIAG